MAKRKEITLWTVRNKCGQYCATYYAYTAEQAINRLISDEMRTASTFRRSQPTKVQASDFTATCEQTCRA